MFNKVVIISLSAALIDDFLLNRRKGSGSSSDTPVSAVHTGIASVLLMIAASVLCFPVRNFVLAPLGLSALNTLAGLIMTVLCAYLLHWLLGKCGEGSSIPAAGVESGCERGSSFIGGIRAALPCAVINCAVFGTVLLSGESGMGFLQTLTFAAMCAVLFAVVSFLYSSLSDRMRFSEIPAVFSGLPIRLITAAAIAIIALGYDSF